jgi:cytochrome c oxidase subunit 4
MSETTADTEAPVEEHEEHAHPSDWAYVKIAVVLGLVTALEVSTYFSSVVDWGDALIPSLMIMMVLKFYLVVMWFMHLKFDSPLFMKMFVGGLILAVGVYVATLTVFEFFA